VNKVILFGRLGKDPEAMKGNTPGCRFSLATTESYKDKASGERKERTEWHSIQAWGVTATFILKNVKKGMQALIEGKITHNEYEGKTYTNIVVKDITPVWPPRGEQGQDKPAGDSSTREPADEPGRVAATDTADDDIPF
jgi:single-strand DNA-binding protein